MWSQVYAICMNIIQSIETRIDNHGKPPPPAQPPAPAIEPKQRGSAALRNDPIFTQAKPSSPYSVDQVARRIANASKSSTLLSDLSPTAKKTWKQAKERVRASEQRNQGQIEKVGLYLTSFGWFQAFQQKFHTELAGVVLGTPYAEPSLYIDAANALCQLAVHSLGEDQFGNVHRDVPSIIRTFTSVIVKVEAIKQSFPVHWTDVGGSRDCPEVDIVLDALRTGLGQVVASFEPFCHDLRLTAGDLRHAKEAATKPEPVQPVQQVEERRRREEPAPRPEIRRRQSRPDRPESRPEMEQVRQRHW